MTDDWNATEGDDEADPGFVGGGSIPETLDDDTDAELDEHGDRLAGADEDDL